MAGSPSGQTTIIIEWSLVALALVFVLLRVWVRLSKLQNRFLLSDYFLLAGWVVLVGATACDTLLWVGGAMPPEKDIRTLRLSERLMKVSYANGALFQAGLFFPRASIAAFYYTVFPKGTKLRKALYVTIGYHIICAIITLLFFVAYCRPISINWSTDPDIDHCSVIVAEEAFSIFWAINVTCDIALFVIPFFLLKQLSLKRSQRFGLIGVFLVGAITIAVSISRFSAIQSSKIVTQVYIWSTAEFAGSVIVACLPSLKVLLQSAVRIVGGTSQGPKSGNQFPTSPTPPSGRGRRSWPFGSIFSVRGPSMHETRSESNTRLSSAIGQFPRHPSDATTSFSSARTLEENRIIESFKQDTTHLSTNHNRDRSGSGSHIELSRLEDQPSRRGSDFEILKTNDLQFEVHIHTGGSPNNCDRRPSGSNINNDTLLCAAVEYVPGGKSAFETKVWV